MRLCRSYLYPGYKLVKLSYNIASRCLGAHGMSRNKKQLNGTATGTNPATTSAAVEGRDDGEVNVLATQKKLKPTSTSGARASKKKNSQASCIQQWFSDEEKRQIRTSLLDWYDQHHRVLPWRRTPHSKRTGPAGNGEQPADSQLSQQQFAYFVWVSEIMLQQTQVATVVPYFKKWVSKWPTVLELAGAGLEEVNAMWAGLGYYRRARYLLDGAKYVVENLDGTFPTTAKELLQIPGIGAYTSAAIASIVFDDPTAVVDGNVIRVISRMRALEGDPSKLGAVHTAIAQDMLDMQRPGCFNQAVMELGATICKPQNPACESCPVSSSCKAHTAWQQYLENGGDADLEDALRVTNYPNRKPAKEKREQSVAVCVLEVIECPKAGRDQGCAAAQATTRPAKKRARTMLDYIAPLGQDSETSTMLASSDRWYLLIKRPECGLLAGLWEFPGAEFEGQLSLQQRQELVNAHIERLLKTKLLSKGCAKAASPSSGLQVLSRHACGTYIHIFSHIRQTNYVERLTVCVDNLANVHGFAAASDSTSTADDGMCQAAAGSGAAGTKVQLRWLRQDQVSKEGLSTGPKKIFKLACG